MSKSAVKIGVVGVGHLGRWHVQQLKAVPGAQLTAIFDSDLSRAEQIGAEFGVPVVDGFESLLETCDALNIVTPTSSHFDYAQRAIRAGKHVFIEKPITETVEQGEELIRLVKEQGIKLQVGHIERFNPAILSLQDVIENPLFIESHRLANFNPRGTDVAVVLDLMIHDIDLILSFVHSPVKTIHSSGVAIISDSEDIANCRLEFENGCVANVTASRISARNMRKMRFFQPDAYISVDFMEGSSDVYYIADTGSKPKDGTLPFALGQIGDEHNKRQIRYARYEKKEVNPLNYELSLFIRSILEDTTTAVTVEQSVRALRVAQNILQKIEEHAQQIKSHWSI